MVQWSTALGCTLESSVKKEIRPRCQYIYRQRIEDDVKLHTMAEVRRMRPWNVRDDVKLGHR